MNFQDIYDIIERVHPSNLELYLIVRKPKELSKQSKKKVLEKFNFEAYKLEIDLNIKDYFYDLTKQQIEKQIKKKVKLNDYDPISDDTNKAFTYQMHNKTLSFSEVLNSQLNNTRTTLMSLNEVISVGELWAYSVRFIINENSSLTTFRKTSKSAVAVELQDNNPSFLKKVNAYFNTNTSKLEMFSGEQISFDSHLDCIYFEEVFYVIQKSNFESIVGIAEEFKAAANSLYQELEKSSLISGLSILENQINENSTTHRKLARLAKLQNHKNLDIYKIEAMKNAAFLDNKILKLNEDGKILLENDDDVDLFIKLLSDYYKKGLVFEKVYGSMSGKIIEEKK